MKCQWMIASMMLALATTARAEPPPPAPANSYLPPQSGGGYAPPSQYGPPSGSAGLRQTDAVFRPQPSSKYGPPGGSRRPPSQYGPPSRQLTQLSTEYGPPTARQQNTPFTEFGPPPAQRTPSVEYGPPIQQNGVARSDSSPQRQYLPPSRGGTEEVYPDARGGQGDEEEANYSFEYMVKDDSSGNDFGHRESRTGDNVEGVYYVLLPDGRKQTVEYMADQGGYRPKISYEQVSSGEREGGYDQSSQKRAGGAGGPY